MTGFIQVNQQEVSTFVTAGNIKFMLLHNGKNEDSIKNFFTDVYEIYVKVTSLFHNLIMLIVLSIILFWPFTISFLFKKNLLMNIYKYK